MTIIGFHFTGKVYSEAERTRWLTQIKRIHPRFIVVVIADQRKEATQFVREVRTQCPHTKVIIRHCADGPDEGMWKRIDPVDYVQRIGGLYTEQLADLDGWYLMPDNEFSSTSRDDYDAWMAWLALAAREAHRIGLRLALGCQPTHNPEPPLIAAGWLDVLFQVFKAYPEHIYYRNVYYDAQNRDGLRYVRVITERMKQMAGYVPAIVIGEFGRLRTITDAQHGYKSTGIPRRDLAVEAVSLFRTYLQGLSPLGIYVCWFCVGEWPTGHDTFNIAPDDDDAFFDELAKVANEKLPDTAPLPSPEPTPTPLPTEPPTEDDTVKIPTVTDFARTTLERQIKSYTALATSIKAQQAILDASAQEVQALLLRCQLELEKLDDAALAA